MITKVLSATALITCLATAGSAATFNGDTADFRLSASGLGEIAGQSSVIGAGRELEISNELFLDMDDLTVKITYDITGFPEVGADTTWNITGLDANDGSRISGFTLTGGNGRLVSGTSFTADSLTIDFFNFTAAQSPGAQTWEFEIATSPIPLPATLPLMMLGFGALAMNRRRKAA